MSQTFTRYIDELAQMKCAADLFALKLFPNGKEITESFAAFNAVRKHLFKQFHPGDPDVAMAAVGDGVSPRTAATFAFRTRWTCHSIDPKLRAGKWHIKRRRNHMQRVELYPCKVEDCKLPVQQKLVIVCVHSHADLLATVQALPAVNVAIVAIPCCVPQELPVKPDIEYQDLGIWSPKNTIKVWK